MIIIRIVNIIWINNVIRTVNIIKDKKNKIIFQIEQNPFINKTKEYGKYNLIGISTNNIFENNIFYEQKEISNPIHAYELTADNNEIIQIKYDLTNEIQKEYIYKITYIEDSNINNEIKLKDYVISQKDQKNLTLIVNFISFCKSFFNQIKNY